MWRHNWFVCLYETSVMDCIFSVFKHDPPRDVHFKLNQRLSVIIHKNLNNTWMNSTTTLNVLLMEALTVFEDVGTC